MKRLVTLMSLCRILKLSRNWLKNEAKERRIPCLKAGNKTLFDPAEVECALAVRAKFSALTSEGGGLR